MVAGERVGPQCKPHACLLIGLYGCLWPVEETVRSWAVNHRHTRFRKPLWLTWAGMVAMDQGRSRTEEAGLLCPPADQRSLD